MHVVGDAATPHQSQLRRRRGEWVGAGDETAEHEPTAGLQRAKRSWHRGFELRSVEEERREPHAVVLFNVLQGSDVLRTDRDAILQPSLADTRFRQL